MFDSPFSIAATILDLAKLHLYHYYYNILKPAFAPDEVHLIMSDTDSLIFEVECENVFKKYKNLSLTLGALCGSTWTPVKNYTKV